MSPTLNRREFVTSAAAGIAAARPAPALGRAPALQAPPSVPPVVVASANGHRYTNGGTETCVETAFRRMTSGEDVLDALIAGVNIVELDPEDASVGYGGRPNADGVVQLDACCMHGPKRRAGGVAALEGVRTPSSVARAVADLTDHHLLVGPGARRFARQLGFTVEDDLNTERSRRLWLEWKRRTDPGHYLDPDRPFGPIPNEGPDGAARGDAAGLDLVAEGVITEDELYGTINCDGINAAGDICGPVGRGLGVVRSSRLWGWSACAARFDIRGWCMLRPEVHLVSRVREIRTHGLNGGLALSRSVSSTGAKWDLPNGHYRLNGHRCRHRDPDRDRHVFPEPAQRDARSGGGRAPAHRRAGRRPAPAHRRSERTYGSAPRTDGPPRRPARGPPRGHHQASGVKPGA